MPPRHGNNIFMVKLATSKKVTLTNGRVFYTKYKRVKRDALPNDITIKRIYIKDTQEQANTVVG